MAMPRQKSKTRSTHNVKAKIQDNRCSQRILNDNAKAKIQDKDTTLKCDNVKVKIQDKGAMLPSSLGNFGTCQPDIPVLTWVTHHDPGQSW
jgi:hypothetical protein